MRLFVCTDSPLYEQEAMLRSAARTKGFVLLLEDSEDDAFFLDRAWKARGIPEEIFRVENGSQAKQLLLKKLAENCRPQLIITDLKMPECDGFEFLRWLRGQPELRAIKCVVLSSSREARDTFEAKVSGADAFFTKPSNSKAYADVLTDIAVHLAPDQGVTISRPRQAVAHSKNEWMQ